MFVDNMGRHLSLIASEAYGTVAGRRKLWIQPIFMCFFTIFLHNVYFGQCEKVSGDDANLRRATRQNVTIASPIGIGQIYVKHGNKTNQPNSNYVVDTVYFAIEVPNKEEKKEAYGYNKPSGGSDYKNDNNNNNNYQQQNASSYPASQNNGPYPPPERRINTYNNAPPPPAAAQYGGNVGAQPLYQPSPQQQQYGQKQQSMPSNYSPQANELQFNASSSGADNDNDAAPNYATSSYTNSYNNKTAANTNIGYGNNGANSYNQANNYGNSSTQARGQPQQQQYGQLQYVKCPPCITYGPPPPPPPYGPPPPPAAHGNGINNNYAPIHTYQQPQAAPRQMAYSSPPSYNGPPPPPPPSAYNNAYQQNRYMPPPPPPPPQYMQQQQQPYYNPPPKYPPVVYTTEAPTTTTTSTAAPTTKPYKKVYSLYDRTHSQKLGGGNAGIYKNGVNYTFDMDGSSDTWNGNQNNGNNGSGDNGGSGNDGGALDDSSDNWQPEQEWSNGPSQPYGKKVQNSYNSGNNHAPINGQYSQQSQPYRQQYRPPPPNYGGPPQSPSYGPPPTYGPPPMYGSPHSPAPSNYGQQQPAAYGHPSPTGGSYSPSYQANPYPTSSYGASAASQGGYYGSAPPMSSYNASLPGPPQSYSSGGSSYGSPAPSPYSPPSYGAAPPYHPSVPPTYGSLPSNYGGGPSYQQPSAPYTTATYGAPTPAVMPSYVRGYNNSFGGSPAGSAYSPGVEFDISDGITEIGTTQIQGQPAQMASQVAFAPLALSSAAHAPAPSPSSYGANGGPPQIPGAPTYGPPPLPQAPTYQHTYGSAGLPTVNPAPYSRGGNYSFTGHSSYALPSPNNYYTSSAMQPLVPYPPGPQHPPYSPSGPAQYPTGPAQAVWSIQLPSPIPPQQPYPAYPSPASYGSSYGSSYSALYSPAYQVYPSHPAYPGAYRTTSSTPSSSTSSSTTSMTSTSTTTPSTTTSTSTSTTTPSTTTSTSTSTSTSTTTPSTTTSTSTSTTTPSTTTSTSTSTTTPSTTTASTTESTSTLTSTLTSTSTSTTSTSTSSTSSTSTSTSTTTVAPTPAPGAPAPAGGRFNRFPTLSLQQQLLNEHIVDTLPSFDAGDDLSVPGNDGFFDQQGASALALAGPQASGAINPFGDISHDELDIGDRTVRSLGKTATAVKVDN